MPRLPASSARVKGPVVKRSAGRSATWATTDHACEPLPTPRSSCSYQLAACGIILKRGNHDREKRAMARITRAAPHLSVEEIRERMSNDPRSFYRKRWLIIYNALVDPREAKDIARHTGVSVATVHKLISSYNRLGVAAVETPGKGGRRNEYMTWEEERELLRPFLSWQKRGN